DRDNLKPGAKYYEWERRGACLRMEIGPRDVAGGTAFCKKRTGGAKFALPVADAVTEVRRVLAEIQQELLDRATTLRDSRTQVVTTYDDFKARLEADGGWLRVFWCDDGEAEARIKEETKATIRCFPMEGQEAAVGEACFYSGRPATHVALFA